MWIYQWDGKDGNACRACGDEIHAIGYYLLEKAVELFHKHGMKMVSFKEKFGRFELYAYAETDEQRQVVRDTLQFYMQAYPELTWEFSE